jgi:hypothetical protein
MSSATPQQHVDHSRISPGDALTAEFRTALRAHAPLKALLGGACVYLGEQANITLPYVLAWPAENPFVEHQYFVSLEVHTFGRSHAHEICAAINEALDAAYPILFDGCRVTSLRRVMMNVGRARDGSYAATLRYRLATEALVSAQIIAFETPRP